MDYRCLLLIGIVLIIIMIYLYHCFYYHYIVLLTWMSHQVVEGSVHISISNSNYIPNIMDK